MCAGHKTTKTHVFLDSGDWGKCQDYIDPQVKKNDAYLFKLRPFLSILTRSRLSGVRCPDLLPGYLQAVSHHKYWDQCQPFGNI